MPARRWNARAVALRPLPSNRRSGVPVSRRRLSRRIPACRSRERCTNATATVGRPLPKASGCHISRSSDATRSSHEQQRTAERFGVHYDLWQSEKELHDTGKIAEGIERLRERGLTYEQRRRRCSSARPISATTRIASSLRSDGRPTYYALDVTYHYQKLQRADRVIDILGPDHHGYIVAPASAGRGARFSRSSSTC